MKFIFFISFEMPVFKTKESYWKIRRRKGFLIETFCSVLSPPCSLLRACHLRQLVLLPRREPLSPLLRDSSLRHLVLLLWDPVLLNGDQPAGPASGQPSHQQGLLRLSVDAWLQLGIRMGSVQLSIQVKTCCSYIVDSLILYGTIFAQSFFILQVHI